MYVQLYHDRLFFNQKGVEKKRKKDRRDANFENAVAVITVMSVTTYFLTTWTHLTWPDL